MAALSDKQTEHNLGQHMKKFHENAFPEPISCQYCTEIKQLRNRYQSPSSASTAQRSSSSETGT